MISLTTKVVVSTVLIVGMVGAAVSHDLSRQRAIEAEYRQTEFCHQYHDYHVRMYLDTRDVKYLRRLQNPVEHAKPCKQFFTARLENERY